MNAKDKLALSGANAAIGKRLLPAEGTTDLRLRTLKGLLEQAAELADETGKEHHKSALRLMACKLRRHRETVVGIMCGD